MKRDITPRIIAPLAAFFLRGGPLFCNLHVVICADNIIRTLEYG